MSLPSSKKLKGTTLKMFINEGNEFEDPNN